MKFFFGQANGSEAQNTELVWSAWETSIREAVTALAWPDKDRITPGPVGQNGELSLMLAPAEPVDEGLRRLKEPGGSGSWTYGSPSAVFVDWTHAEGLRGRLVRMDSHGRAIWNVPGMTLVHNFSDFKILHPTLGIKLKMAQSSGRPAIPNEALMLQKMWSLA